MGEKVAQNFTQKREKSEIAKCLKLKGSAVPEQMPFLGGSVPLLFLNCSGLFRKTPEQRNLIKSITYKSCSGLFQAKFLKRRLLFRCSSLLRLGTVNRNIQKNDEKRGKKSE